MSKFQFQKATKRQARARIALVGPSGSGKTYTSLVIGTALGKRVAVIDTEHGSASKYAWSGPKDACPKGQFVFDVLELDSFSPATYVEAIHAAEADNYDVVVIDSLSHAWMGKDGALEMADRASARGGENRFTAWRHVTPQQTAMIEALIGSRAHIIATMRTKTEYVIEENEKGKKVPRKIGLAPVQRDGLEYEFDLVGDMDHENRLFVTKSRCSSLSGAVIVRPDEALAEQILAWLSDGSAPAPSIAERIAAEAEIIRDKASLAAFRARVKEVWGRLTGPERERVTVAGKDAAERVDAIVAQNQAEAAQ